MLKKTKQQNWQVGDLFVVQTKDGKCVIGQIVGQETEVLNSASVAFFDRRSDSNSPSFEIGSISENEAFAVLFATRDQLDSGEWKVISHHRLLVSDKMRPYENLRNNGWVGAKVIGSANINEFLNAFYALCPWDDWKDPSYLDRFLISPEKKPLNVVYKNQ